jgi:hypothetical protein
MGFRKFLYELFEAEFEVAGAEMSYHIDFPEAIKNEPEMCQDLLEEFEREVKAIAWKMGLKLTEK